MKTKQKKQGKENNSLIASSIPISKKKTVPTTPSAKQRKAKVPNLPKEVPNLSKILKEKVEAKKFDHKEHWKGMPEFNQPNMKPVHQVLVGFANKEDMHKFSKVVGQSITAKTKSIWYPEVLETGALDKRWSKE